MKNTTAQSPSAPSPSDSLFIGENLAFLEALYHQYLGDPGSVDASWTAVFEEYLGHSPTMGGSNGSYPTFRARSIFAPAIVVTGGGAGVTEDPVIVDRTEASKVVAPGRSAGFAAQVELLARAYRTFGHLVAQVDPLKNERPQPKELELAQYGLSPGDLGAKVVYTSLFGDKEVTLGQLLERLRQLYCGAIGVEYPQSAPIEARQWLREQVEAHSFAAIGGTQEQKAILQKLLEADAFESFLHKKYVGAKRFSVTGGDSLIPMLHAMIEEGGSLGVQEMVFGMAHRGRLNVLHNILQKPAANMFSEFEKNPKPEAYLGSSDVKYHMGYSHDHVTSAGASVHLTLCFNPSHLEFVNPVVMGRARAKQDRLASERAKQAVVPVLIHGDAAFAGQGIVAEGLNMARVPAYDVGGTVHIIVNNQIGFTTLPGDSRSTTYASDVAKLLGVPIFHVNGDDPEACVRVMKLALRYRQMFGEDVVIDVVCYRQYGHNEGDEPRHTQPAMYRAIDAMRPLRERYAETLLAQGALTQEELEARWEARQEIYNEAFKQVRQAPLPKKISSMEGLWAGYKYGAIAPGDLDVDTSLPKEELVAIGLRVAGIPQDVQAHRTLRRLVQMREKMARGEEPMDWGMGESMAFASLVKAGVRVRLTGQDAIRGTFSHRHAALFEQEANAPYWALRQWDGDVTPAAFDVYNSVLSEAAVLGYEYGYSLDTPDGLTMWEAQFGDFVNGAQVLIDQFINSSEAKWKRLSGLVMLLPHGYEGQGPEHSSARLERFLQLCAHDNMFVCNFTTPAQYFHALRRHMLSKVRKPMVVMTPKSLLRHKDAVSTLADLSEGRFQPVIPEVRQGIDPEKVRRVLLCSGKVYYDLVEYARQHGIEDAAVVRVEQLFPLDTPALHAALAPFEKREELVWVQEEPKNMGAWHYIFPLLIEQFGAQPLPRYAGRAASASPATGSFETHEYEQQLLMAQAFAKG